VLDAVRDAARDCEAELEREDVALLERVAKAVLEALGGALEVGAEEAERTAEAFGVQVGSLEAVEALVREAEGLVEMLGHEVPLGVREGCTERDSDEQALPERVDAAVREALGEALAVRARDAAVEADTVDVQVERKDNVKAFEREEEALGVVQEVRVPGGGRVKSAERESEGEALPERVGATDREALGEALAVSAEEAEKYGERV
jgi:hypothetical protein